MLLSPQSRRVCVQETIFLKDMSDKFVYLLKLYQKQGLSEFCLPSIILENEITRFIGQ